MPWDVSCQHSDNLIRSGKLLQIFVPSRSHVVSVVSCVSWHLSARHPEPHSPVIPAPKATASWPQFLWTLVYCILWCLCSPSKHQNMSKPVSETILKNEQRNESTIYESLQSIYKAWIWLNMQVSSRFIHSGWIPRLQDSYTTPCSFMRFPWHMCWVFLRGSNTGITFLSLEGREHSAHSTTLLRLIVPLRMVPQFILWLFWKSI